VGDWCRGVAAEAGFACIDARTPDSMCRFSRSGGQGAAVYHQVAGLCSSDACRVSRGACLCRWFLRGAPLVREGDRGRLFTIGGGGNQKHTTG
jgi:hypothetical protein